MAETFRRVLWFLPVLAVGAVLLFLALGSTRPVSEKLARPLFYNPSPISAQTAAKAALESVLDKSPSAESRLIELGGAALPALLEELTSLPVSQRRLVAENLWPLAKRMGLSEQRSWTGLGSKDHAPDVDSKLLFWERYAEEHSLDLRPLSVARLVKRMAARDLKLRNADLIAVDTYALPTMISNIGRINTHADVARARRLVAMIAHVTGEEWEIALDATPREAKGIATKIRHMWDEKAPQWTQLNRFELLVARFSQTEFTTWIVRTVRELTGVDTGTLSARLVSHSRVSVPLLGLALLGLLLVGPMMAAVIQVLQLKESRWKLERMGLRAALSAGLLIITPLLITRRSAGWYELLAISLGAGTLYSTFVLHRELNDKLDWRTHHVLRSRALTSRVTAVGRWLAPSLPTMTPMAVAEAALWVTCLEASTNTNGLGMQSLSALRGGDLYFLMAICLALGLTTGVAQVLADLLLGSSRLKRGEI